MNGILSAQPLAELIREISIKGLSGTLRLERERAQTAVYFDSGQLIYAASNLRKLRLRKYLSKQGIIPEREHSSRDNNLSDLDLAAALTATGTVRKNEVDAVLSILVRDVLRVALLWMEGSWDFNERARLADSVRVNVDRPALLREAAQRMSSKLVSQRFRNPKETISRASDVSPTSNFLPAESFILSRLDEPVSVRELVLTSGLQELDAYRVIYGLALCGLIKRQYWQNAFRTDSAKTNEEQAEVLVAPAPTVSELEQTDKWLGASVENEELERFLHRLKTATDYYEVIELPPTANAGEIKDAYYAIARRYHPDRFHLQSGTRVHAEISSAFARVTQAYETLTDPTARSAYDQTLERSRQFWESAPKPSQPDVEDSVDDFEFAANAAETELGRAEYSFREGFGALQQGRINAAVTHLATASRLFPHEARYRAYYGRALAADEKTRRLAENEIQAAVKLEPANAAFRIMLAELYFDLKFHRRAQTELDRALAIDPKNAAAHSLLRKLEKSRKVG